MGRGECQLRQLRHLSLRRYGATGPKDGSIGMLGTGNVEGEKSLRKIPDADDKETPRPSRGQD
jgi:hypothetical protein